MGDRRSVSRRLRGLVGRLWRSLRGEGSEAVLARGAMGSFAVRTAGKGLAFGAQVVFTRLLGAGPYGTYIYALTWMQVLALIGLFGFSKATVRFVGEYAGSRDWARLRGYLRYVRRFVGLASLATAAGFAGATWLLTGGPESAILRTTCWLAAGVLPVYGLMQIEGAALRGAKHVVRGMLPLNVIRPAGLITGLPLLAIGVSALTAVHAMMVELAATAVALGGAVWMLQRTFPDAYAEAEVREERSHWFRTGRNLLLVAGFNMLLFRADTIMVGAIANTEQAGLYAVASKLALVVIFVLEAVNSMLSPMAADLHGRERRGELQRLVTLSAVVSLVGGLGVGLVLYLWPAPVLSLFGPEFTVGATALLVLVAGQVVNAAAGPAVLLLNMTDYQRDSAWILGASAALNLVLNGALIPFFGFVGAAWATTITMVVWNVLAVWLTWHRLRILALPIPWNWFDRERPE